MQRHLRVFLNRRFLCETLGGLGYLNILIGMRA